jgi:L-threonylcarbamoyladenylate synthase
LSQTGNTQILRLKPESWSQVLDKAARTIAEGSLLIFPTDTVYGIGGAAFIPSVYDLLMELKGAREQKAYALLVSSLEIMERVAGRALDGTALRLAQRFWPGALTIVWHGSLGINREFAAPDGSIGYRLPDHAFLRELIAAGDGALWATSANPPGAVPPMAFDGIESAVMEKAALAIDGGETLAGLPSTVVDARTWPVKIVRKGAIPGDEIQAFLSEGSDA